MTKREVTSPEKNGMNNVKEAILQKTVVLYAHYKD